MEKLKLTKSDCELLLQSLGYTKQAFSNYKHYPSYDFKLERMSCVDRLREKIITIKKGIRNGKTRSV